MYSTMRHYRLIHYMGRGSAYWQRSVNIGLHIVVCLVYNETIKAVFGRLYHVTTLLKHAILLYAVHPVHTETVTSLLRHYHVTITWCSYRVTSAILAANDDAIITNE